MRRERLTAGRKDEQAIGGSGLPGARRDQHVANGGTVLVPKVEQAEISVEFSQGWIRGNGTRAAGGRRRRGWGFTAGWCRTVLGMTEAGGRSGGVGGDGEGGGGG